MRASNKSTLQIAFLATSTGPQKPASTSKRTSVRTAAWATGRTDARTTVRTTASLGFATAETSETESAQHNMLQAQSVAVEAAHSACRGLRSAKAKATCFVGSHVQCARFYKLPTFGQLNEKELTMKKATLEQNFTAVKETSVGTMMSDGKTTIYVRKVNGNTYIRRMSTNGIVYDKKLV